MSKKYLQLTILNYRNYMDAQIAANALFRGLILLTSDRRDFGKVPGLPIEDWTV